MVTNVADGTSEARLLEVLRDANPWWEAGVRVRPSIPPFHRREFPALRPRLGDPGVLAITGPRQAGKSTLLRQLIHGLLEGGTDPTHLLYLPMDLPVLTLGPTDVLSTALETYRQSVLRVSWGQLDTPCFVFLDEVSQQPTWHRALKGWHDLGRPIKFVISDSNASSLMEGAAESLVGRCSIHRLPMLSFWDVVAFQRGAGPPPSPPPLEDLLRRTVSRGGAGALRSGLDRWKTSWHLQEGQVLNVTNRYLLQGGHPGLLAKVDPVECERELRDYLSLVVARDLLRHYHLRDVPGLDGLLGILADWTAERMEWTSLARSTGQSVESVRTYVQRLEGLGLLSTARRFAASRAASLRKQPKIYFTDIGVANAVSGRFGPSLFERPDRLGRVVEAAVYDHARRLAEVLSPGLDRSLPYWGASRGREVDMVLRVGTSVVPLEVKYQRQLGPSDLGPVHEFLEEERRAPFGLVITRDTAGREGDVVMVPLHEFLLAV